MKIILKVLTILLYFYHVSPVLMYYIYEDTPQAGYVDFQSQTENQQIGFKRKQHLAHYDSAIKYSKDRNGQMLDSHFKIKKTAEKLYTPPVERLKIPELPNHVENPKSPVTSDILHRDVLKADSKKKQVQIDSVGSSNSNIPQIIPQVLAGPKPVSDSKHYIFLRGSKKEHNEINRRLPIVAPVSQYPIRNSLSVNVHRTPIQTEPQKVRLNNNQQLTAISIPGPANHYHKIATAEIVDKTLQKKTRNIAKDAQIMSSVLDDMTDKMSSGKSKKSKRKVTSDALKKYIGKDDDNDYPSSKSHFRFNKKDVLDRLAKFNTYLERRLSAQSFQSKLSGNDKRKMVDHPKINSRDDIFKESYVPFALFYRVNSDFRPNPETGFVSIQSKSILGNKEKSILIRHEKEDNFNKNIPKLHKNYRKF